MVLASGSVMVDDMALHLHAVGQCAEEEAFARSLRAGASHDDATISRCQRRLEFRCASQIGGRGIRIERDLMGASACLCNTSKQPVVNALRTVPRRLPASVRAQGRRMAGHPETVPTQAVFTHRRSWSRGGALSTSPFRPCHHAGGKPGKDFSRKCT